MSLTRGVKLALMLSLVAISLGLSGYSFYRSRHPKIVEKIIEKPVDRPVDRIVEKKVTVPCPSQRPAKINPTQEAKKEQATPPIKQDCGGGNCAASVGQQGGVTAGEIITTEDILPNISVTQEDVGPDPVHDHTEYGSHPGVVLHITLDRKFSNPTFIAQCDRPCTGRGVDLGNVGWFAPGMGNERPEIPWLHFEVPHVLSSTVTVNWTLKSNDELPIKVTNVSPYRIK